AGAPSDGSVDCQLPDLPTDRRRNSKRPLARGCSERCRAPLGERSTQRPRFGAKTQAARAPANRPKCYSASSPRVDTTGEVVARIARSAAQHDEEEKMHATGAAAVGATRAREERARLPTPRTALCGQPTVVRRGGGS